MTSYWIGLILNTKETIYINRLRKAVVMQLHLCAQKKTTTRRVKGGDKSRVMNVNEISKLYEYNIN